MSEYKSQISNSHISLDPYLKIDFGVIFKCGSYQLNNYLF